MDCNIVKDLIPLYIDECCSEESAAEVKTHLESCTDCKAVFEAMSSSSENTVSPLPKKSLCRVNDWKASVLQSVLLFASFLFITVGVALEARTPAGISNGFWAFNLVIPATGFMLSLPNWYFIKLYKSRKAFSRCSCALTVLITFAAAVWTATHYEMFVLGNGLFEFIKNLFSIANFMLFFYGYGLVAAIVLAALSKILSDKYAKMLGKE